MNLMTMTYPALEHEALDFFDYLPNFSKTWNLKRNLKTFNNNLWKRLNIKLCRMSSASMEPKWKRLLEVLALIITAMFFFFIKRNRTINTLKNTIKNHFTNVLQSCQNAIFTYIIIWLFLKYNMVFKKWWEKHCANLKEKNLCGRKS